MMSRGVTWIEVDRAPERSFLAAMVAVQIEFHIGQRRVSFGQRIIQIERLQSVIFRSLITVQPWRRSVKLKQRVTISPTGVGEGEFGVFPDRFVEVFDRFIEAIDAAFAQ